MLFRKKPENTFTSVNKEGQALKPQLSLFYIVLYGVAGVVGAGIFATPGEIIKNYTGPAVVVSFALAAIACLLTAVCYADFSARYPAAGGSYAYVYTTLGEYAAFIAAVGNTFEYAFAGAGVARSWSTYFMKFVPSAKSYNFVQPDPDKNEIFAPDIYAPLLCLFLTCICLLGVKQSSRMSAVVTVINVTGILFIVVVGMFFVESKNYEPFFPKEPSGVFRGAANAFFSYIAWDSVCVMSEEVKNPRSNIPRALFAVITIVTVVYGSVVTVLAGMKPAQELSEEAAFMDAFPSDHFAVVVIAVIILLCGANSTYASIQGQPRVWFGMARDGLVPSQFEQVSASGTPVFSLIMTGLMTMLVSGLFSFNRIADATIAVVLLVQGLVSIGCLFNRVGNNIKRPALFKTILGLMVITVLTGASCFELTDRKKHDTVNAQSAWISCGVLLSASLILGLALIILLQSSVRSTACIPVAATLVNFFFVGVTGFNSLWQMVAILAAFSIIYFAYGIRFSKLKV